MCSAGLLKELVGPATFDPYWTSATLRMSDAAQERQGCFAEAGSSKDRMNALTELADRLRNLLQENQALIEQLDNLDKPLSEHLSLAVPTSDIESAATELREALRRIENALYHLPD